MFLSLRSVALRFQIVSIKSEGHWFNLTKPLASLNQPYQARDVTIQTVRDEYLVREAASDPKLAFGEPFKKS